MKSNPSSGKHANPKIIESVFMDSGSDSEKPLALNIPSGCCLLPLRRDSRPEGGRAELHFVVNSCLAGTAEELSRLEQFADRGVMVLRLEPAEVPDQALEPQCLSA